jgi:hypothetical protein
VGRIIYILCLLLTSFSSLAEDVRFTVSVSSQRISMQDFLQVEYLIENSRKVSQFLPPDLSAFDVVEGPEQASGWNMEDGVLKEYVSFTYLLKPRKEGRFVIPLATARIDGKVYRTKSVMVEVVSSVIPGISEDMNFADELVMRKNEKLADKVRNNIFLRLEVNKSSCYEGEAVIATYKLYTRLRSESKIIKRPSFNGFSVYDMVNPETEGPARERLNGREYSVYTLRKVQLYPLQSGTITLDPIEVENTLTFVKSEELKSGVSLDRILRNLSEGNDDEAVIRESLVLATTPATVQVTPFPNPAMAGFSGAVGNFDVKAMVSSSSVQQNDVVNLVIRVSGKGNFPMFGAPEVRWPNATEVFESSVQEHFSKFVSPIAGSKVYNFPFTVQQAGHIVIPPVTLAYFDPGKGSYALAQSDSVMLYVGAAARKSNYKKISIPAVQTETDGTWMWVLYLAGFIVVGGSTYLLMKRGGGKPRVQAPQVDPEPRKMVQPEPDPLHELRHAFEQGNSKEFYRQLGFVINDCLRRKYQVDDPRNWESELRKKGVDDAMIASIRSLKMVDDLARIEKMIC